MNTNMEILSQLKQLDLTKYPDKEIVTLIENYGEQLLLKKDVKIGDKIIRARAHTKKEFLKSFNTRSELSYKPQKWNLKYQRASTPHQTMFYGCPFLDPLGNEPRLTSLLEASDLKRNNKSGEEKITFSVWEVIKPISLTAICFTADFLLDGSHEKELHDQYHNTLNKLEPNRAKKLKEMAIYIANEFAKEVKCNDGDYCYMISSIISKMLVESNKDGIYYPSVKTKDTEYKSFNMAISPNVADSSLKLIFAVECIFYKIGNEEFLDDERIAFIEDDTIEFKYEPVNPPNYIGRDKVLQYLENEIRKKQSH